MPNYSVRLGLVGPGEYTDDARPESWNEKIMEVFPNGAVSLTAITGMFPERSITDQKHNWKTRTLTSQSGAVTNIYIDSALSTAYVYASHQSTYGIAGGVVYVKCALATAKEFREGHQVRLRDSDRLDVDVTGKVVDVRHNGASSYIAVKLLEADDNDTVSATYNLATVDRIMVIGNVNSVAGTRPRAISYDPIDVYNYTHIFRTPFEVAGSTLSVDLRGRDAYAQEMRDALLIHSIEKEKALLWSVRSANTGANKKKEYTMMGIDQFIKTYMSSNVSDFSLSTTYSGKTWIQSGLDWFDDMMQQIFHEGDGTLGGEVLGVCGDAAAKGIMRMVRNNTLYSISSETAEYGIKLHKLTSIFGDLLIKVHPLLSQDTTTANTMFVIPPDKCTKLPLKGRDTHHKADKLYDQGGSTGVDGKQEEFLTEHTYEYGIGAWGRLDGIGKDNVV